MTTKLDVSPVSRLLETVIEERPVTVTLEVQEGVPLLRLRAKGHRTGWFVNLDNLCEIASWHPRLKSKDMELRMTPRIELKKALEETNWEELYGKELL